MKQLYARLFQLLLLTIYFSGCAGSNSQVVQSGTWGGEHIGMIITDSSATLDYDCAHGSIDEPISTDDMGIFEAVGVLKRADLSDLEKFPISILLYTMEVLREKR